MAGLPPVEAQNTLYTKTIIPKYQSNHVSADSQVEPKDTFLATFYYFTGWAGAQELVLMQQHYFSAHSCLFVQCDI